MNNQPQKGRARKLRTRLSIALVIVVLLLGRGLFFRPGTNYPGAHFNHGDNAAWLGVEWSNQTHDAAEIATLAADLQQRQISTLYVYSSYLKDNGNFNPSYAHAAAFISALKAHTPDLNIQAWIGLPLTYVALENNETRAQITEFSATLVQDFGFDGIHYDPEPIANGDEDVLRLLEETRAALPSETRLSIATRRIGVIFPETKLPLWRPFAWSAAYYRQIATRVDEIAVMSYDSTLPHAALYRKWLQLEVSALSRALADSQVKVYVGIPSSEERTFTHVPQAENMSSGLQGLIAGLNDNASQPAAISGCAIYPYWETQASEWETYQELWLKQE